MYDEALALSSQEHYRFGTVRALLPVGYLTMMSGTARQAAEVFRRTAEIARDLDERVYLAGALTGLGEALGRLRDDDEAEQALASALTLFKSLRSDAGIVNAAQHPGDLHRRRGELVKAGALLSHALETAQRSGPWIGVVNAADGLGEISLGLGDAEQAAQHYVHAYQLSADKGYLRGLAHAMNGLGRCAAAASNWPEAQRLHEAAGRTKARETVPGGVVALIRPTMMSPLATWSQSANSQWLAEAVLEAIARNPLANATCNALLASILHGCDVLA